MMRALQGLRTSLDVLQFHHKPIKDNLLKCGSRSLCSSPIVLLKSCHAPPETTLYDELGLEPSASSQDIKDSYFRLSKQYHPDVNADDPEALQKFHKISEAYSTLGEPKLRRMYDRGKLGRTTTAADRDTVLHRFDGDSFVDSRAVLRSEYAKEQGHRDHIDGYVKDITALNFVRLKANRDTAVRKGTQKRYEGVTPERVGRSKAVYSSSSSSKNGGGGGGLTIIVACSVIIVALWKLFKC